MSRSAWICLLLVCEVTRRFPGILGQCTNHTRPRVMKASPNNRKPIVGFQTTGSVCEWKIMADEGYLIQVTVPKPNVPAPRNASCNLTDLHFYDGESPHRTLLKGVCDFKGNLKVTSRGQVLLVQLPPAALADKDSGQRWTLFGYTAYPCGSPQVYFRTCKTPTLAGTTQRTRDTTTTTSKQLTTTTTTNITTTTNNAEVNTFVIFVVSTVSALGLVLTAAIFCCLKCYRDSLCCRCQCSMKPFTRTWSRWWRKKERERETENERDIERERQRRTRTLAAESAFVNEGVLSSDQDQTHTLRGSLSTSTGDGQSGVESVESRTLSDSAFINEGFLSSDQDQAHTLRDFLSASTEDGQSGVESMEPPRLLQQEFSPPPPHYSSLEFAEMDVHAQAQDEPPPPPSYTEVMKTAYPPV